MKTRFIVDTNVGKLAKWLRIMGYDALFINGIDDDQLIKIALEEKRIILTRDTHIFERRIASKLKGILIENDDIWTQLRQVVHTLNLRYKRRQFTLCIGCSQALIPKEKEEVRELVPPYVFQTQSKYMQCPTCGKIYWRGTHWQRMRKELERLAVNSAEQLAEDE